MNIKNVLKENNFTFKKAFGQNFLTDENLLGSIVERSGVTKETPVIEIGVGGGTLTAEIAKRAKFVYGYEIDNNLKPVLQETLKDYNNISIIYKDIMKASITEIEEMIGEEYIMVANLPYYITTPIIMKFIEEATLCKSIVITIQKEVAERIVAKEKTADYGSITVSINAVADTKIIEYIGREMFYPSPNVDSAVVKIDMNKTKYQINDIQKFRNLVKCAFTMRRKTLVNNLMKGYSLSRENAENLLTSQNISVSVRGEELSVLEFINLSNNM